MIVIWLLCYHTLKTQIIRVCVYMRTNINHKLKLILSSFVKITYYVLSEVPTNSHYIQTKQTSFPSKNMPRPSDTIKSNWDIAFPVPDLWRDWASFSSTVHIFSSCAILVFFCSKVNCWRMDAPACSLNGSSKEWISRASSPKLNTKKYR